jgi:hypothetical protein
MVRTSGRLQILSDLLDNIVEANIIETLLSDTDMDCSDDSDSTSGCTDSDNSSSCIFSDSELDESNSEENARISEELLDVYAALSEERYIAPRNSIPRRSEKMIDVLESMSQTSPKRFRGFVRMSPKAFDDLVTRLRKTNAFRNGRKSHAWVTERVATVMYRFGRSGNEQAFGMLL